jgi:glutathione S-transferase
MLTASTKEFFYQDVRMSLTLYYHPLSSFCHKVLIALYENDCAFDKRIIDLGNEADRAELAAMWPFCKFPVLRDHMRKRDVAESSVIIEYLDHFFAGHAPLIPAEWENALETRHWDRVLDNYVHGPMQQIVSDRIRGAQADLTGERTTMQTAYAMLDRHLPGKTWMTGPHFSLADCAAAPALFYASIVEPFPADCRHLVAYFDRLTQRPSVRRVLEEAQPYFSLYPFEESIPARFRHPSAL